MSQNKNTIQKYMDSFQETNHEKILSCLTQDVIWEMPGVYLHHGKEAFDKEIETKTLPENLKLQFSE